MTREEIIKVFEGIADILQIKGEDTGKVKMYRNLAITLSYELPEDISAQLDKGSLTKNSWGLVQQRWIKSLRL